MEKIKTQTKFIILICLAVAATALFTYINFIASDIRYGELHNLQDSFNVPVQKGKIESPSVIIQVDTIAEFKSKINELGANVVYYQDGLGGTRYYYVFTQDFNIAYELYVHRGNNLEDYQTN